MEYFAALGLEPALHLNLADLEQRFYKASRELHPDRFARAPVDEQKRALDRSSILNTAYRTLREPVSRAEYLLRQSGVASKDLPPGFLEEAFELNEAVENGGDAEREKLRGMLEEIDTRLASQFQAWDESRGAEVLQEIRRTLNQRRYIENLVNGHLPD